MSTRSPTCADGGREEPGADEEHRQPDDHERDPVRRRVDQREKGAEEHQRAAEVADEDEHHHRGAPDDEHRPEVLERRKRDPGEPLGADDEDLPVLAQVAGQEDDDRELAELGRLERERTDLHAEVGAVDLGPIPGRRGSSSSTRPPITIRYR